LALSFVVMREAFQGDLARLGEQLVGMCGLVAGSMRSATHALLSADLAVAEQVLSADTEVDRRRRECEDHAQALLALQAPVARDLRAVLAAVYCAEKIERMGDLAAHIADATRFAHPARAVPAELEVSFAEMGAIAADMADRVGELVMTEAGGGFAELDQADHAMDALHARVLELITGPEWPHGVRSATSLALVARFYERFADQAVSVAKRLEFAVTGTLPGA
jgi:phosphate transport system protein